MIMLINSSLFKNTKYLSDFYFNSKIKIQSSNSEQGKNM